MSALEGEFILDGEGMKHFATGLSTGPFRSVYDAFKLPVYTCRLHGDVDQVLTLSFAPEKDEKQKAHSYCMHCLANRLSFALVEPKETLQWPLNPPATD